MNTFLDLMIPRFITEEVAANYVEGEWRPICSMEDITYEDTYDAVLIVRAFNLFGLGLFPSLVKVKENG